MAKVSVQYEAVDREGGETFRRSVPVDFLEGNPDRQYWDAAAADFIEYLTYRETTQFETFPGVKANATYYADHNITITWDDESQTRQVFHIEVTNAELPDDGEADKE